VVDEDGKIDFGGYTPPALQEARSNIHPEKHPKNFANLIAEFRRRGLQPVETEDTQATDQDYSTHVPGEAARSPIKARVTGFLTLVFGLAWFLLRYDDGVYHGRRGREYTFDDDPTFLTFIFAMHGLVILIGLLGLIFGSSFYRDVIQSQSSSSPFKRRD
jgi:hypothetical protein